jgi:hypothetical protein
MPKRTSALLSRGVLWGSWAALGLLLLGSFALDFRHVTEGGAIDLRNRVTGARLLVAHLDPYFYKWQEPDPPAFADPYNNPLLPVSKTTATPTLLLLGEPIALLPYRAGQFAWLGCQWLFLLGTAAFWLPRCDGRWHRLLLGTFVTGFTYTAAWRLHAERGQAYVLIVFIFALWLGITLRNKPGAAWWVGLLAGLLIALRPPFLLLVPFVSFHRPRQLPALAAGLLLAALLPLCWRGDAWQKYAAAMQVHSANYRGDIDPAPPPQRFPPEIEGVPTDLLGSFVDLPYSDFSVHGALGRLELEPAPDWLPLGLVTGAYAGWVWLTRAREGRRLLLGLAIWFFLVDLCLPAYRNIYNDVFILNIAALGLVAGRGVIIPWGVRVCLAGLVLGWLIALFAPRHDLLTDLPSLTFTLGAALLLFWFNFPADPFKVKAAC